MTEEEKKAYNEAKDEIALNDEKFKAVWVEQAGDSKGTDEEIAMKKR